MRVTLCVFFANNGICTIVVFYLVYDGKCVLSSKQRRTSIVPIVTVCMRVSLFSTASVEALSATRQCGGYATRPSNSVQATYEWVSREEFPLDATRLFGL